MPQDSYRSGDGVHDLNPFCFLHLRRKEKVMTLKKFLMKITSIQTYQLLAGFKRKKNKLHRNIHVSKI